MDNMSFAPWSGHEKQIEQIELEIFPEDCWSLASIKESVDFPIFFGEVCLLGEEIVAYYGMNIIAGEGYIANIAVAKFFQGKGLGNILMSRMLDTTKQRCEEITLEVRVSNQRAIALYQKFGFVGEGTRKNFYQDGEDALIMWRRKQTNLDK